MENFTKLGLSQELTDVLRTSGFKEPSEIQEKTIPAALAGRDIIGGSATGSGKTFAFASAILENMKSIREVQAIILTPTRELAEQVATSIRKFGKNKNLKVLAVYGGIRIDSQIRKISTTDIVVGTPGRILDHLDRKTLRLNKVKFLVLDEVDRMFDMGFSKDVEKIIKECPKERQTMMFSATISPEIDYLAKKYTKDPLEININSQVDPSKLTQVYYDIPDHKKFSLLVGLLKQEKADLVMVFCSTRRNVDFIAENLISIGLSAKAIHGGLEQKKRIRVLEEFHQKGLGILICTDVAARGLDIKGVSHVYNYDIPASVNDYIHRIGRTARAGKEGKAITILARRDYEKFRILTKSKEIKITPENLPELENISVCLHSGRNDRFNRGSNRESFNRGPRRDNRDSPRRSFGGGSRKDSNNNRDSPRRSFGRNSRGDSRSPSRGSDTKRPTSGRSFGRNNSKGSKTGPRSFNRGPKRNNRRG